jgi:RNA polymerase sigma-70 factor (ECF subfamily)
VTTASGTIVSTGVHASTRRLSGLDDLALIDCFLGGHDDQAFEVLIRRYQQKVHNLAASILGRVAAIEAEDVAQEVFLSVYRQLHRYRGESSFSTWLYSITRNQAISRLRLQRNKTVHVSDDVLADRADATGDLVINSSDDLRAQLHFHIANLTDHQRAIIELFYWYGHSNAEVAELLGMNVNTIKSTLRRIRKQLEAAICGDNDER